MSAQELDPTEAAQKDPHHDSIRLPRAVQDILNDPEAFKPRGNLTAVDIYSTTDIFKCKASSKPIDSNLASVKEWLSADVDKSDPLSYTMRLLFCPQYSRSSSSYPFTMDKPTAEYVVETMKIPSSYVSLVPQHNARYIRIFGPKTKGIILHMRNPGFSLIVTYQEDEQLIHGLMLGLLPDDISKLVDAIETSDLTCWPPVLVCVCLLELKAAWVDRNSTQCYEKLVKTEKEIGTFTDYLMGKMNRDVDWLQNLDTETLAGDLTIISTSVARVDHQCNVAQKMINIVEEDYDAYLKDVAETANNGKRPSHHSVANTSLLTKISELRSSFNVLLLEGVFYLRRTEANRQTIYSLIAQKDNNTSLKISRTNLQIARTSFADNKIMIRIAETNTRDSAAMVIISIVTIAFLPGTFVSSLFSTTIFNFQAQPGNSVTNKYWHGIYWGITAPLTVVILVAGYLFWMIRRNLDQKQLKNDQGELRATEQTVEEGYYDTTAGAERNEKSG
jgi:hypothetical protein